SRHGSYSKSKITQRKYQFSFFSITGSMSAFVNPPNGSWGDGSSPFYNHAVREVYALANDLEMEKSTSFASAKTSLSRLVERTLTIHPLPWVEFVSPSKVQPSFRICGAT